MRRWFIAAILLVPLLAACAAQEKALPGEGPAPAAPAPAPEAKPAWQGEWERVLAAAKQEGKVALLTAAREARVRQALSQPFERKYGITVEVLAASGTEAAPRVRTERQAGQYLWDLYAAGLGSQVFIRDLAVLEPIEPTLILPEVKEPKNWFEGKLHIVDRDRQIMMYSISTSEAFVINKSLARPEEFKSYKDFLDPKWKGKILVIDPKVAGPPQSRFHHFYVHKDLGPDFIRSLAKQDLVLLRDEGLALEWVAQGKYPILLGGAIGRTLEMVRRGVPIHIVDGKGLREGSYMSWGPGGISLFKNAPHPNAARLYINWLLSKEGQTEIARAGERPSLRLDVPKDFIEPLMLPVEGYINVEGTDERLVERRNVLIPFLNEVFKD